MDIATQIRLQQAAKEFLKETLEGFALLVVIFSVTDKPMNKKQTWFRIAKISVLLGAVNAGMSYFDEESHGKMKEGMKASLGNTMLASVVGGRR